MTAYGHAPQPKAFGSPTSTGPNPLSMGVTPLRRERRGDIRVVLDVDVPSSLSEQERELLEQFAALRGDETTRRSKGQRGPFAKLRERLRDF